MARRANGEGSIFRQGDYWLAQITVARDPKTGRQKYKRSPRCKTKAEAARWLRETLHSQDRGLLSDKSMITLGQWLDVWLREYKQQQIRPTTLRIYSGVIRLHLSELANIKLDKLTPPMIQHLLNSRADKPGTARNMARVLVQALNKAVEIGYIQKNPAKLAHPPRYQPKEMQVMTPEQLQKFLDAAKNYRCYPVMYVLACTGLRRGEVLGLRWADVDLTKKTISISQQVVVIDHKPVITEPKTQKSRRTIPIPAEAVKVLRQWKQAQAKERLFLGSAWTDLDLTFSNEIGCPLEPHNFSRDFRRIRDVAGLPKWIHPHSLRHGYASLLLAAGTHIKVCQELLGHTSVGVTLNTYSKTTMGLKEQAVETLNSIFKHSEPASTDTKKGG